MVEPNTPAEAASALRVATEIGASVIPVGLGTKLGLGNRPRAADVLLSTAKLNRVIEHEPANLTVIVEAGLGLRELQARLAESGQLLPLGDLTGTVGGAVATNASGPLRLGYGTARDLLIGARVAVADGKLARAGGKVVKNVAGYDLCKLYIGSLGTLGVLVELAFKLAPLPTTRHTHLSAHADPISAQQMVGRLLRSSLRPLAADLLSPAAAASLGLPASGWTLAILVGGVAATARRQIDDLGRLALGVGTSSQEVIGSESSDDFWRRESALNEEGGPLLAKASVPVPDVPFAVEALGRAARRLGDPAIWARAGSGIVYARWSAAPTAQEASEVAEGLSGARREIAGRGGALVLESSPPLVGDRIDAWGDVGEALGAMRALKAQFDPSGTLNPGRFVGGI
jgi:glycolate oxidase FAD binding subunit